MVRFLGKTQNKWFSHWLTTNIMRGHLSITTEPTVWSSIEDCCTSWLDKWAQEQTQKLLWVTQAQIYFWTWNVTFSPSLHWEYRPETVPRSCIWIMMILFPINSTLVYRMVSLSNLLMPLILLTPDSTYPKILINGYLASFAGIERHWWWSSQEGTVLGTLLLRSRW